MSGFFANAGSSDQIISLSQTYEKLAFPTAKYDTSGVYDAVNYRWTPNPATASEPILVHFDWQVWITGGLSSEAGAQVVKLIKNGAPIGDSYGGTDEFTGIRETFSTMPGVASIGSGGDDLAQPGDYYELIVFLVIAASNPPYPSSGGPGTAMIDTNKAHTYWCGHVVGRP